MNCGSVTYYLEMSTGVDITLNRFDRVYRAGVRCPVASNSKSAPGYYWDCKHQSVVIRNKKDEIIIDLVDQITQQFPQIDLNCL